MKIEYRKTSTLPSDIRKVNGYLSLVDNSVNVNEAGDDYVSMLLMYFPAKDGFHCFTVYPTEEHGTLTKLIDEIGAAVWNGDVKEFNPDDKSDLMVALHSAAFELIKADEAESNIRPVSKDMDPRNKIFYQFTTGEGYYSDINKLPVKDLIDNIGSIYQSVRNIKNLMALLVTTDHVDEVDENGKVIEGGGKSPIDIAREEIRKFHEDNKMRVNYSMFENQFTTERELLLMQLTDIVEIYQNLILMASVIKAQNPEPADESTTEAAE